MRGSMSGLAFAKTIAMLSAIPDEMDAFSRGGYKDALDDIDLNAEYELIQQKKSKLSANDRRRVVFIVEAKREGIK